MKVSLFFALPYSPRMGENSKAHSLSAYNLNFKHTGNTFVSDLKQVGLPHCHVIINTKEV